MTTLRPYQSQLLHEVRQAWTTNRNVAMVLSTGGGKTVCLSTLVHEHQGHSAVIAHRAELVSQLSMALARYGVRHNLIAAKAVAKAISHEHVAEFGRSYYDPNARCAVASIDTLVRADGLEGWASQVTLWITDEGHHCVEHNKWDKGVKLFTHPACRGLLPTATPERADGQGLGRPELGGSGVADAMVQGPSMRWLIEEGYLCDYRIFCPTGDLVVLKEAAASGDWSPAALKEAARQSHIVGDVVREYRRFAAGKLGVTFTTDVETAQAIMLAYRAAGVPAEMLTGKTDMGLRRQVLHRFARREILQLVAVDIISEGFDLPAMEVGSGARPTQSLPLWMQQFGRVLRPFYAPGFDLSSTDGRLAAIAASNKPKAIWIDHVGNFARPGLGPPDRPRPWSLQDREGKGRKKDPDEVPQRVCVECAQPSEAFYPACKHCGAPWPEPEPDARSSPARVDGDLGELDLETLTALRQAVMATDLGPEAYAAQLVVQGCPPIGVAPNVRRHEATRQAQQQLRDAMARWGGQFHAAGESDKMIQRRFFYQFGGVDVLSAMALKTDEANALREKIEVTLCAL